MRTSAAVRPTDRPDPPPLPGWLTTPAAERPQDLPFLAGAALASLHGLQGHPAVPQALWRARLALRAAAACARWERRRETEAELRDALHLLRPGDHPGPAGAILQLWTRAGAPPLAVLDGACLLPDLDAEAQTAGQAAGQGAAAPVARAAAVLEAVLTAAPRAETAALILAEAALGRSLGWRHLTPLLAPGLSARDLRASGPELQLACHRALVRAAGPASRLAAELARMAAPDQPFRRDGRADPLRRRAGRTRHPRSAAHH